MRKLLKVFIGVGMMAAAVTPFDVAIAETAPPPNPAGQQNPVYCDTLHQVIDGVVSAIRESIARVNADVEFSKNKYAPTYPKAALPQLNAAIAKINELKGQLKDPKVTYASASSINSYMDAAIVFLHSARYQSMVSATNNQSQPGRAAYNSITLAVAKAEAAGVQGARCYMSPYAPG